MPNHGLYESKRSQSPAGGIYEALLASITHRTHGSESQGIFIIKYQYETQLYLPLNGWCGWRLVTFHSDSDIALSQLPCPAISQQSTSGQVCCSPIGYNMWVFGQSLMSKDLACLHSFFGLFNWYWSHITNGVCKCCLAQYYRLSVHIPLQPTKWDRF